MLLDKRIFDSVLSAASNGMCGMLTQSYRNNNKKKNNTSNGNSNKKQEKKKYIQREMSSNDVLLFLYHIIKCARVKYGMKAR